jgi:hypothetical protein
VSGAGMDVPSVPDPIHVGAGLETTA